MEEARKADEAAKLEQERMHKLKLENEKKELMKAEHEYHQKMKHDEESTKSAISEGKLSTHYYDASFPDPLTKEQLSWLNENEITCVMKDY